jgi:hypothetical protein
MKIIDSVLVFMSADPLTRLTMEMVAYSLCPEHVQQLRLEFQAMDKNQANATAAKAAAAARKDATIRENINFVYGRTEPGAGAIRGAAVERRAEDDDIGVGETGRIIEVGSHDALLAQGGRYAEMVALQAPAG